MDNLIDIVKLRREKVMEELYDGLLKKFDSYNSVFLSSVDRSYGGRDAVVFVVPPIHFKQFVEKIKEKGFIIEYQGVDQYENEFVKVKIDELN
jgi:hypothetical protein